MGNMVCISYSVTERPHASQIKIDSLSTCILSQVGCLCVYLLSIDMGYSWDH